MQFIRLHEFQIVLGSEHISFTTTKIGSLLDVEDSKDPEGLRVFYYLVQVQPASSCPFVEIFNYNCGILQDLKCFVFAICQMHFKIKPIS